VGQFQAGNAVANLLGDNVCPFGASVGQHYGKFFAAVARLAAMAIAPATPAQTIVPADVPIKLVVKFRKVDVKHN